MRKIHINNKNISINNIVLLHALLQDFVQSLPQCPTVHAKHIKQIYNAQKQQQQQGNKLKGNM